MFKKFFRSVRKVAKNIAPIAAPIAGFAFGAPAGIGIGALLGQYGGKEGALRAAALGGIGGLAGNYAQTGKLFGARGVLGEGGVGFKEGAKNLFMGRLPAGVDPSVAAADAYKSTRTGGIFDLFGKIPGGKTLATAFAINQILNPPEKEDDTTQDEPVADAFKDLDVADIQYPDPTPVFVAEGGIMSLDKGGTVDDYGGIQAFKRKNGEIAGPGTMTSDDIPAMLSDGEFVTKAISVLGAGVKHGGAKTKDEARKKGAEFFYNQQRELEPFGKKGSVMAIEETRVRQPEFIEKRSEQLLKSVFGDPDAVQQAGESEADFNLRKFGLSGVSQPVPGQQIARFSQDQLDAFGNIRQGIGAFQPALTAGLDAAAAATGTGVLAGQTLAGAQQAFDPTTQVDPFMNQYNKFVIDEIQRQGDISRNRLRGEATRRGAFGGSRAAIQEAELDRGIAGQVGLAQQRAFDSALKAAQASQEAQQRRQLAAGQQLGNLARTQGGLAGIFGGLGQLQQGLNLKDQQALLGVGQAQQQLQQAGLDTARRNLITAQQEPFRRMQFASDVLRGVPSGQTTFRDVPEGNPLLEYAGLGIAGISALGAFGDAFPNSPFTSFLRG